MPLEIEPLLLKAMKLKGRARAEFLRKVAAKDKKIAERLSSLLKAQTKSVSLPDELTADPDLGDTSQYGSFEVQGVVARGGMASVLAVRDRDTGESLAIKVPHEHLASDALQNERFRREFKILKRVRHSNVVRAGQYFKKKNGPFFSMDLIQHKPNVVPSLRRAIDDQRPDIEQSVEWTIQMLAGLDAIHHQKVIHRDLKPDNVLVNERSEAVIVDLGIAAIDAIDAKTLTVAHLVPGTRYYMSPEQRKGMKLTVTSDVYSAGMVAYELLTGERPKSEPVLPSKLNANIVPSLDSIILKALATSVRDRYASAADFRNALLDLPQTSSRRKRVARLRNAAICVIALCVCGMLFAKMTAEPNSEPTETGRTETNTTAAARINVQPPTVSVTDPKYSNKLAVAGEDLVLELYHTTYGDQKPEPVEFRVRGQKDWTAATGKKIRLADVPLGPVTVEFRTIGPKGEPSQLYVYHTTVSHYVDDVADAVLDFDEDINVQAVSFAKNRPYVLTHPRKEYVIANVATGREVYRMDYRSRMTDFAVHPHFSQTAMAFTDGSLELISDSDQQTVWNNDNTNPSITNMAFSQDGKLFACGLSSQEILILNAETGSEVRKLLCDDGDFRRIAFTLDDSQLFVSHGDTFTAWEVDNWKRRTSFSALGVVDFDLTNKWVLYGQSGETITVHDLKHKDQLLLNQTHDLPYIKTRRLSPDGQLIAVCYNGGLVIIWSTQAGDPITQFVIRPSRRRPFELPPKYHLEFHPDSTQLLIAIGPKAAVISTSSEIE